MRAAWILAGLAACGRIDFPDLGRTQDAGRDGGGDSSADATPSSLIHQYSLDNSYADDLGGPPLNGLGGTLSAGGYAFNNNLGLSVSNAVPASLYTIDIVFEFDDVMNYRKLIDFKALGSDAGLYIVNSTLQFVVIPVTGCPGSDCYTSAALFANGAVHQVTLARDDVGTVTAFVDRALQFSFSDSGAVGAFDTPGAAANFFIDDNSTTTEFGSGTVTRIRIYDAALDAGGVPPAAAAPNGGAVQ